MRRFPKIVIGLATSLLLAVTTTTSAHAVGPVFKVFPSGLARISLTDADDDLTIWSTGPDSVDYELADGQGDVVATGTMEGVRKVRVKMMGGDDMLAVGDAGLLADLTVYSGNGDDVILLQRLDSPADQQARIYSGSGDDDIIADFAEGTPDHFWVFADGGDDTVELRNSSFDVDRLGIFDVESGSGNDTVYTEGNSFGRFRARTHGGTDDWTSMSDTFHGLLNYSSRGEDDTVTVSAANVLSGAKVTMGSGADTVDVVSGSFVGTVVFDGGVGTADQLTIGSETTFDRPPIVLRFVV